MAVESKFHFNVDGIEYHYPSSSGYGTVYVRFMIDVLEDHDELNDSSWDYDPSFEVDEQSWLLYGVVDVK